MVARASKSATEIDDTIDLLHDEIRCLEAYLRVQLARRDFHGVSDAANDLRVLEAELQTIERLR
jgi:uncharacterized small protein (DUF1192 family)